MSRKGWPASAAELSSRASAQDPGPSRLESGAPSKAAKPSTWRAASHIGSVVDDWPMYSSQPSDYILGPPIGFGASSIVYQASFQPLHGRACAVKVIDLEGFGRDLAELRRETQLMSLSKHPNVLRVRGCWVKDSKLHIATRFMSSGSMLDIMRFSFPEGFEENVIATVLKQALEGLNYLHINGWLHRDLKAANMLVDEDGTVLLGDFGVGVYLNEASKGVSIPPKDTQLPDDVNQQARKSFVGTPCWMAPEVVERKGYGAKADIWSFGITALELSLGHAPHSRLPPAKVLMRTLQDEPPTLDRTGGAFKYSKTFDDFVRVCLQKDPAKRPSSEKLLGHAFLRQAKPKRHLVHTILAGLPPLAERQERKRAMSIASLHNHLSWDFNSTISAGTNSRLHTPLHERVDPFTNFSGFVSSPLGSVRSSKLLMDPDQADDTASRKSRPGSDDFGSMSTTGSWARRLSRGQRRSVSFDVDHEDALANSTDLANSGELHLPPIAEAKNDVHASLASKQDVPKQSNPTEAASSQPDQSMHEAGGRIDSGDGKTPPLTNDSGPSSNAGSMEGRHSTGSLPEARPEETKKEHDSRKPKERLQSTGGILTKIFKRA